MTDKINNALRVYFGNFDYQLFNSYIFSWESDFFGISKSGYCYEVEVKISRSDFKADFKKTQKHFMLKNSDKDKIIIPGIINKHQDAFSCRKEIFENQEITISKTIVPNKFYYACPHGLIEENEIPDYAGLFYFDEDKYPLSCITEIKKAKFLNKNKYLKDNWFLKSLLDKFYYQSMNLKSEIRELKNDISRYNDYYNHQEEFKDTLF